MSEAERRAAALAAAEAPVVDVRLVDDRRAEALARLGVSTVRDLLHHVPFRYLDLSARATLADARPGTDVTVVGTVHAITVKRPRPRLTIVEVALTDGTGAVIGVWFNQPYMAQRFREGERVAFAGRVELEYGLKQMRQPFVEKLGDARAPEETARIIPIHRATEGLSTNWVRRLAAEALAHAGDLPDHLPAWIRRSRDLMSLRHALRAVHFPQDAAEAEAARRRLAYDELFAIQVGMALRRHNAVDERTGHVHEVEGERSARFPDVVGFQLTADQEHAIAEILADLASRRPMNRMLLGDVGTGKTAVAAAALAAVADSGTQAAMMAPTEVLAAQYAEKVGPLLDALDVSWRLLTGATPAAERAATLDAIARGDVCVSFGTHALLQANVAFAHLTLAIVDEQHRFGVTQRLALREKGEATDLLVMSATPIPRSLALTLYGDLDTSYLRVRPAGRGPDHVTTRLVPRGARGAAYDQVRAAVADGRQAYIVCPLVEESEKAEAKAATTEYGRLRRQVFPSLRLGLLTGQMKTAEKRDVMRRFRAGEIDILVATTVIEVGVDVPNATVMIVENAERYGLAQLHQLRGRIGRGEHPGEFLLFADPKTDEGRARMQAIASTNDGFELAEHDLRLRGEGDVLGPRQSGLPALRLASLTDDFALVEQAREDARAIVSADPHLADPGNALLRREVRRTFADAWEWVSAG